MLEKELETLRAENESLRESLREERERARRFYLADGSYIEAEPEVIIARRKEAAKEIAALSTRLHAVSESAFDLRLLVQRQVEAMNNGPMGDLNYAGIEWLRAARAALSGVSAPDKRDAVVEAARELCNAPVSNGIIERAVERFSNLRAAVRSLDELVIVSPEGK